MPRTPNLAVNSVLAASLAVALSTSSLSAQVALGGFETMNHQFGPEDVNGKCHGGYKYLPVPWGWIRVSNCNQPRIDLTPDSFAFSGWVFVTDTGDDHSTISSGEITTVYGLDANQGVGDPILIGMTPGNHEFEVIADDTITTRPGGSYAASSYQAVPLFQLPEMLPGHDLSMVDFSDPFSVVHVFRTYVPLNEIWYECSADMNNDGVLDLTDISAFIGSFLAGQFGADFNFDGVYDLTDLVDFIDGFTSGCP